jgi:hypothetical protein
MRRNSPAELGSLSSISKDGSRSKAGSSGETGLRDTDAVSGVTVAAVLFSRIRYGQFCIVVRGHDVGCCDFGSWQHDSLDVLKSVPSGQAVAGQRVGMTPKASASMNAVADLIIEVDVPNRILVGSILHAPKIQRTRTEVTPPAKSKKSKTLNPDTLQAATVNAHRPLERH